MVSTTKTIVSRSAYSAPACKLYSIHVESVMNPGSPGGAGGDDEIVDGGDF